MSRHACYILSNSATMGRRLKPLMRQIKKRYVITSKLGGDDQGVILNGFRKADRKPVVMQCFFPEMNQLCECIMCDAMEFPMLKEICYFVRCCGKRFLIDAFDVIGSNNDQWAIVFEQNIGRHSTDFLKNKPLSEARSKKYSKQILRAILQLKSMLMAFEHLTLDTIFYIEERDEIQLAALWNCNDIPFVARPVIPYDERYITPESVYSGTHEWEQYTAWSLGHIIFELLHCRCAFASVEEVLTEPVKCDAHLSRDVIHLISRCLEKDSQKRANLQEILSHSWWRADERSLTSLTLNVIQQTPVLNWQTSSQGMRKQFDNELINWCHPSVFWTELMRHTFPEESFCNYSLDRWEEARRHYYYLIDRYAYSFVKF